MYTANLGFRNISLSMKLLVAEGKIERAPSHESCIRWQLKIGYFKLTRAQDAAADWIWIADHAIKTGPYKCLAILGIKTEQIAQRKDLTLTLEDVQPLALVPMRTSNGSTVGEEFEKLARRIGEPKGIIIDHGSDLKCGAASFASRHSGVRCFYDVVHKIAAELSRLMKDDLSWLEFTAKAASAKKQLQQTLYSRQAPPNQRSKARWLNFDILVDWADSTITGWDSRISERPDQLKWLDKFRPNISMWSQFVEVARVTREIVRVHGYSRQLPGLLEEALLKIDTSAPFAEVLACTLIDFVGQESGQLSEKELMIGSSEVIESAFGWLNYRAGPTAQQNAHGFGRLLLAFASRLGGLSIDIVDQAFRSVKESDIDQWRKEVYH
jgi:hypothetical protein